MRTKAAQKRSERSKIRAERSKSRTRRAVKEPSKSLAPPEDTESIVPDASTEVKKVRPAFNRGEKFRKASKT
jgi:hypothetical protein